jgi:transposase-like protein
VTAPVPPKLIPKGLLSIDFVVRMVVMKYLLGLPLHRIALLLQMEGLTVSPGTLVGTLHKLVPMLQPIYDAICARNRADHHWHADETSWKVFVEIDGKSHHRWWLWVFSGADSTVFIVSPTRRAQVPRDHLVLTAPMGAEGFPSRPRVLMTDFYAAYRALVTDILHAWCWAHIRRKFLQAGTSVEALSAWSARWILRIQDLYAWHAARRAAEVGSADWQAAEAALQDWVTESALLWRQELQDPNLLLRARAVLETVERQWGGLTLFLTDPLVALDNNEAERLLRTPVVGRKNYYGSRAQWSGELAAMLWTLWATAAHNGLNPQKYLAAILEATAAQNGQPLDAEAVTRFLPWALREADRTAWSQESAS